MLGVAVVALCLLAWRPWSVGPAGETEGRFAVVIAVGAETLLSIQTTEDVVWSPTAGELIVPVSLWPGSGEQVLLLDANAEGFPQWRWLPATGRAIADGVSLAGLTDSGHLRLRTGQQTATLAAGESWSYQVSSGELVELYYAGAFARLHAAPSVAEPALRN